MKTLIEKTSDNLVKAFLNNKTIAPIPSKFSKKLSEAQKFRKLCESKIKLPVIGFKAAGTGIPLIKKFKEKTGCPILVNTSFNVTGEPIVNTPKDAFNCFMGTDLDYLIIGNCVLDKTNQNEDLKKSYSEEFELD